MDAPKQTVLVSGATGAQGGATARALLQAGYKVRALVRDPESAPALALALLGASLVRGSFEDARALRDAAAGADAVFSVQLFNPMQPHLEREQAGALIAAARQAGVRTFVQSSVSGVHAGMAAPDWNEPGWDLPYWRSKAEIEDDVRGAGFDAAIVLRPAFMMENFSAPKAARMFPDLKNGAIRTALAPDTKLALVAAHDIGAACAVAISAPARFSELELAGDWLTFPEIAVTLGRALDRGIVSHSETPADLVAGGQARGWVEMQTWLDRFGYPARPAEMERVGAKPTSLAAWAASTLT